jgi:hypothetical protein
MMSRSAAFRAALAAFIGAIAAFIFLSAVCRAAVEKANFLFSHNAGLHKLERVHRV